MYFVKLGYPITAIKCQPEELVACSLSLSFLRVRGLRQTGIVLRLSFTGLGKVRRDTLHCILIFHSERFRETHTGILATLSAFPSILCLYTLYKLPLPSSARSQLSQLDLPRDERKQGWTTSCRSAGSKSSQSCAATSTRESPNLAQKSRNLAKEFHQPCNSMPHRRRRRWYVWNLNHAADGQTLLALDFDFAFDSKLLQQIGRHGRNRNKNQISLIQMPRNRYKSGRPGSPLAAMTQ